MFDAARYVIVVSFDSLDLEWSSIVAIFNLYGADHFYTIVDAAGCKRYHVLSHASHHDTLASLARLDAAYRVEN